MSIFVFVNAALCPCSLISNFPLMSTLRRRSCLVIPQILLMTDISKTRSFRSCFSFKVHVSALYSTMFWTKVWYNVTLVSLAHMQILPEFSAFFGTVWTVYQLYLLLLALNPACASLRSSAVHVLILCRMTDAKTFLQWGNRLIPL